MVKAGDKRQHESEPTAGVKKSRTDELLTQFSADQLDQAVQLAQDTYPQFENPGDNKQEWLRNVTSSNPGFVNKLKATVLESGGRTDNQQQQPSDIDDDTGNIDNQPEQLKQANKTKGGSQKDEADKQQTAEPPQLKAGREKAQGKADDAENEDDVNDAGDTNEPARLKEGRLKAQGKAQAAEEAEEPAQQKQGSDVPADTADSNVDSNEPPQLKKAREQQQSQPSGSASGSGTFKYDVGSTVTWNWAGTETSGTVKERFTDSVTRELQGAEITKNGTNDNPAYFIEQDNGHGVLKLESELTA